MGAMELSDGHLLSWDLEGPLRLWDSSGQPLATLLGHTDIITGAIELSDERLLSWSQDGTLRLWDSNGQPLATLVGHTGEVFGAIELNDGRLLSWGWDGTIHYWDSNGQALATFQGEIGIVWGAMELSDGRLLLVGELVGEGRNLRLWYPYSVDLAEFACQHIFRDFTEEERIRFGIDDSPTCPQFAESASAEARENP